MNYIISEKINNVFVCWDDNHGMFKNKEIIDKNVKCSYCLNSSKNYKIIDIISTNKSFKFGVFVENMLVCCKCFECLLNSKIIYVNNSFFKKISKNKFLELNPIRDVLEDQYTKNSYEFRISEVAVDFVFKPDVAKIIKSLARNESVAEYRQKSTLGFYKITNILSRDRQNNNEERFIIGHRRLPNQERIENEIVSIGGNYRRAANQEFFAVEGIVSGVPQIENDNGVIFERAAVVNNDNNLRVENNEIRGERLEVNFLDDVGEPNQIEQPQEQVRNEAEHDQEIIDRRNEEQQEDEIEINVNNREIYDRIRERVMHRIQNNFGNE